MGDTEFDPNIERHMQIKQMPDMPPSFTGMITGEELDRYSEDNRPILLAISRLDQRVCWMYSQIKLFNVQSRQSEAAMIEKIQSVRNFGRYVLGTVFVSLVGAVLLAIASKYIHP
jgi:hypothetical protein